MFHSKLKRYLQSSHHKTFSRDFAAYFNKALNFRVGSVAELLKDYEMCGGASEDYYFSTQVNYTENKSL